MAPYLLNVELVESLQRAIQRGRSIEVLGNVGSATLAGMLEYGCLRHEYPDRLPAAPGGINATELGRALAEIVSPLGVREQGPPKPSVKHINAQSVEFQLLPPLSSQGQDIESESFLARFEQSAQQVGFSNGTAAKLQSAFAEMCENAVLHSQSTLTPVAGYAVAEGTAQFSVIDVGIGVKASLAQNPHYANLSTDVDAIARALQTGVSRHPEGGGFGFQSVFKALAEQWGQLRFRSGNGCLSLDGTGLDADRCLRARPLPLAGFQVSICCRKGESAPLTNPF